MKKVGYVDGYILVVPKDKVEEYRKMADEAAELWIKHGAISVKECIGDDLHPDMGEVTLLKYDEILKCSENENVWFSYIEYESKEERDRINKKVEEEMKEQYKDNPEHMQNMPFDMSRMAFGGFTVKVNK